MKPTYKTTIFACFVGYIVQAIVNNFAPLLFITFQNTYQIPLSQITLLVTINFCVPHNQPQTLCRSHLQPQEHLKTLRCEVR